MDDHGASGVPQPAPLAVEEFNDITAVSEGEEDAPSRNSTPDNLAATQEPGALPDIKGTGSALQQQQEGTSTVDPSTAEPIWKRLMKTAIAPSETMPIARFNSILQLARERQSDVQRKIEHTLCGVLHTEESSVLNDSTRESANAGEKPEESSPAGRLFHTHSRKEFQQLFKAHGVVTTIVVPSKTTSPKDEALMTVSYRKQGNPDMYSTHNLQLRQSNRHCPQVEDALGALWSCLPKTASGHINVSTYMWMSRKLYFVLIPGATDRDFRKFVRRDWKSDTHGEKRMTEGMLKDAIFSLADVWCETTDPTEYAQFISTAREIVEAPPAYRGNLLDDDDSEAENEEGSRQRTTSPGTRGSSPASQRKSPGKKTQSPRAGTLDSFLAPLVKERRRSVKDKILEPSGRNDDDTIPPLLSALEIAQLRQGRRTSARPPASPANAQGGVGLLRNSSSAVVSPTRRMSPQRAKDVQSPAANSTSFVGIEDLPPPRPSPPIARRPSNGSSDASSPRMRPAPPPITVPVPHKQFTRSEGFSVWQEDTVHSSVERSPDSSEGATPAATEKEHTDLLSEMSADVLASSTLCRNDLTSLFTDFVAHNEVQEEHDLLSELIQFAEKVSSGGSGLSSSGKLERSFVGIGDNQIGQDLQELKNDVTNHLARQAERRLQQRNGLEADSGLPRPSDSGREADAWESILQAARSAQKARMALRQRLWDMRRKRKTAKVEGLKQKVAGAAANDESNFDADYEVFRGTCDLQALEIKKSLYDFASTNRYDEAALVALLLRNVNDILYDARTDLPRVLSDDALRGTASPPAGSPRQSSLTPPAGAPSGQPNPPMDRQWQAAFNCLKEKRRRGFELLKRILFATEEHAKSAEEMLIGHISEVSKKSAEWELQELRIIDADASLSVQQRGAARKDVESRMQQRVARYKEEIRAARGDTTTVKTQLDLMRELHDSYEQLCAEESSLSGTLTTLDGGIAAARHREMFEDSGDSSSVNAAAPKVACRDLPHASEATTLMEVANVAMTRFSVWIAAQVAKVSTILTSNLFNKALDRINAFFVKEGEHRREMKERQYKRTLITAAMSTNEVESLTLGGRMKLHAKQNRAKWLEQRMLEAESVHAKKTEESHQWQEMQMRHGTTGTAGVSAILSAQCHQILSLTMQKDTHARLAESLHLRQRSIPNPRSSRRASLQSQPHDLPAGSEANAFRYIGGVLDSEGLVAEREAWRARLAEEARLRREREKYERDNQNAHKARMEELRRIDAEIKQAREDAKREARRKGVRLDLSATFHLEETQMSHARELLLQAMDSSKVAWRSALQFYQHVNMKWVSEEKKRKLRAAGIKTPSTLDSPRRVQSLPSPTPPPQKAAFEVPKAAQAPSP